MWHSSKGLLTETSNANLKRCQHHFFCCKLIMYVAIFWSVRSHPTNDLLHIYIFNVGFLNISLFVLFLARSFYILNWFLSNECRQSIYNFVIFPSNSGCLKKHQLQHLIFLDSLLPFYLNPVMVHFLFGLPLLLQWRQFASN